MNEKKIETLRIERAELLKSLSSALKEDLASVSEATKENLDDLIDALVESECEITELNAQIAFADDMLSRMYKREENLIFQTTATPKDILDDTLTRFFLPLCIEKIIAIITMVSSPSYEEFIKRIATVLLISVLTFKLNSDYLTSNYHHNKAKQKLETLKEGIDANLLVKEDLKSCKEMFSVLTDAMNKKILELAPEEMNGLPLNEYLLRIKVIKKCEHIKKRKRTRN